MADKQPAEETEEGKGGKKKIIIMIVGALLLMGISVGATVMLLGGGSAQEEVAAEEAEPDKGDPVYIGLKPFTFNLAPADPVGFLQLEIQVLTYADEVSSDLETHRPLIRNNLTLLFGQQKSIDLRSPEGKQGLQKKVHESVQQVINKYGTGGEVDNIFFTNFVMQ